MHLKVSITASSVHHPISLNLPSQATIEYCWLLHSTFTVPSPLNLSNWASIKSCRLMFVPFIVPSRTIYLIWKVSKGVDCSRFGSPSHLVQFAWLGIYWKLWITVEHIHRRFCSSSHLIPTFLIKKIMKAVDYCKNVQHPTLSVLVQIPRASVDSYTLAFILSSA